MSLVNDWLRSSLGYLREVDDGILKIDELLAIANSRLLTLEKRFSLLDTSRLSVIENPLSIPDILSDLEMRLSAIEGLMEIIDYRLDKARQLLDDSASS
ncbi:MAG: hypothetical protein H7Z41_14575 [Cytophagales bacterium]|nr:hypothetical protein [Armatimonadota bacterium]